MASELLRITRFAAQEFDNFAGFGSEALPLATGVAQPFRAALPTEGGSMRPRRILVIDDSIVFLKAISNKLRSYGYEVLTAVDGSAAVSMVRQAKPDLILLDLNFPPDVAHGGGVAWNGLLILNWLRRMHEAQNTPVIVITGGEVEECHDQCMAAGVLGLFLKPVDHEALIAAIEDALKNHAPDDASPEDTQVRRRVLLVDDETDWLFMGALYLRECGYEVITANDASSAMARAAEMRPDVILLDLNLCDGIGLTLMKLLATTRPQVPILIYTGKELDEAAANELREQGAFDCLQKGTMEELLTAVATAMDAPYQEFALEVPEETHETFDEPADTGIQSVLLVEDDVELGDTLRDFLETHPYVVTRVTDGAEALRQLSAVDFDVILCDIVLPSLSGEELYRAVKSAKPQHCKRFIFMTGHNADPRTDNFIRRIGAMMLWKPFHLTDLLTAVQTISKENGPPPPIKMDRFRELTEDGY
jgi:CheY-like chemotaxis protein